MVGCGVGVVIAGEGLPGEIAMVERGGAVIGLRLAPPSASPRPSATGHQSATWIVDGHPNENRRASD